MGYGCIRFLRNLQRLEHRRCGDLGGKRRNTSDIHAPTAHFNAHSIADCDPDSASDSHTDFHCHNPSDIYGTGCDRYSDSSSANKHARSSSNRYTCAAAPHSDADISDSTERYGIALGRYSTLQRR
jgi:hypothetical protein